MVAEHDNAAAVVGASKEQRGIDLRLLDGAVGITCGDHRADDIDAVGLDAWWMRQFDSRTVAAQLTRCWTTRSSWLS